MARLIVNSGPLAGKSFEVDAELTIGRENAAITLPDEEASRRHAVVRPDGSGIVIEDDGSLNGTWVDDQRIDAATRLRGGEIIRLGDTTLTIEADPEPGAGATRVRARPDVGATVQRPIPPPASEPTEERR